MRATRGSDRSHLVSDSLGSLGHRIRWFLFRSHLRSDSRGILGHRIRWLCVRLHLAFSETGSASSIFTGADVRSRAPVCLCGCQCAFAGGSVRLRAPMCGCGCQCAFAGASVPLRVPSFWAADGSSIVFRMQMEVPSILGC